MYCQEKCIGCLLSKNDWKIWKVYYPVVHGYFIYLQYGCDFRELIITTWNFAQKLSPSITSAYEKHWCVIIACLAGSLQVFRCVIVCKPKALLACDGLRSSFQLTGLEDLEMENITVSISCFACKSPELRKFCFSNVNEEKYIFDLFLHE